MNLQAHYPGATENTEFANAIRDFLFWCRENRINPVPVAVEGIRLAGHWIEDDKLSGWTILEIIDAIPEEYREKDKLDRHHTHVTKYIEIAGEGRENAVQFFCTLAEQLELDDLFAAMGQADRSMAQQLGGGAIYGDEFYDLAELESRFGDQASQIMNDCGVPLDGNVDGKAVSDWIRNNRE